MVANQAAGPQLTAALPTDSSCGLRVSIGRLWKGFQTEHLPHAGGNRQNHGRSLR